MMRFALFLVLLSACGDAGSFDDPMSTGGAGGETVPRGSGGAGGAGGQSAFCRGVLCDDGNECTDDSCDSSTGDCLFEPVAVNTTCDFAGAPGLCEEGVCNDAALCSGVVCDDGLECTMDVCDPLTGSCSGILLPEATMCAQGAGQCRSAVCVEPSWGEPRDLGVLSIASSIVPLPQAAADAAGRTTAVWLSQRRDWSWTVVSSRYTPELGWSPIAGLGVGQQSDADAVDLAVSPNGEAIAVWMQRDTPPSIYSNRYRPDRGWGLPLLVENNRAQVARDPQIAIDASGNAIAVWLRSGRVYANHFSAAGVWGEPQRIGYDSDGASSPRIGVDAEGNATVIWFQSGDVFASHYSVESGWKPPAPIESSNDALTGLPDLAVSPSGEAVALWIERHTGRHDLYANVYSPAAGWNGPQVVDRPPGAVYSARVAIDPNGNAVLIWVQLDGFDRRVYANRYTVEDGWGAAIALEDEDLGEAIEPAVSFDENGRALAIWTQSDGLQQGLRGSRFLPELGWGEPELIAPLARDQLGVFGPCVAAGTEGRAVALYGALEAAHRYEVWASHFE